MNSDKEKQVLEFLDRLISRRFKSDKEVYTANPPCLDENTFGAFLENTLSKKAKAELEAHLLACVACRTQMAGLLKIQAAESRPVSPSPQPSPAHTEKWFRIISVGLFRELGLAHAFSVILIIGVLIYSSVNLLNYVGINHRSKSMVAESKIYTEKAVGLKTMNQGPAAEEKDSSAFKAEQAHSTYGADSLDRPAQNLERRDAGAGGAKAETARARAEDVVAQSAAAAPASGAGTGTSSLPESASVTEPAPAVPPAAAVSSAQPQVLADRFAFTPEAKVKEGDIAMMDKAAADEPKPARKEQGEPYRAKSVRAGANAALQPGAAGGTAGGVASGVVHTTPVARKGEEDLENRIAQRLDELGIPRARGRFMAQTEQARMSAQPIPFSAERSEAKALGAKKEFLFVDGVWVDKEILRAPNQPVKWIKFDSEDYRKLAAEQGDFKGDLLVTRESKIRPADQEDLRKHLARGERILVVHQNQIYYITK